MLKDVFERLEPCAPKGACTVLRGLGAGNRVRLPDTLGRSIKLSARLRDSAGLEAFMLREFFDAPLRRQPGITS